MKFSRKENTAMQRELMRCAPETFNSIMKDVLKIRSTLDVSKVSLIKAAFDNIGLTDRRLFIAIVFKKFHPEMYKEDNTNLSIKQGLGKAVAEELRIKESNCCNLFKEVRTWLKYNVEDLRAKTDEVFESIESKLLTVKSEKCIPSLFE